jgi:gliding motility-associated lipoprotein GldH
MRLSYWPILTIFILSGCDQSRLFEENTDFENRIWLANDIKVIDFVVSDIDNVYNIYFNVRNTMNYPHYNLYISFQLKDSLNRILAEDLQNFNLFDPKTGAPNGKSGLGDIFDHQFPLLEDYSFEYPGEKRLELKQFMRYDSLPDIVSTGMRIEIAGME